mmetsp:Transcript_28968/g.56664  ORF Transcript_28968/g.56664 Transcript_28968/m.56664 type:complete len:89 (+) Transcript_28968:741-1007(+)
MATKGVDVSPDFQVNGKGILMQRDETIPPPVLSEGFKFYYADDAHTKVIHQCDYMACVHVCKSITMQGVMDLKSKHVKTCHQFLTVEV